MMNVYSLGVHDWILSAKLSRTMELLANKFQKRVRYEIVKSARRLVMHNAASSNLDDKEEKLYMMIGEETPRALLALYVG